jgi:hypothetical protein
VSVTLSIVPDVGSTTFSLLIPAAFVSGIGTLNPVTTDAVTTIHRMPFVAQFVGQRELYQVTRMTGTASFLGVLSSPAMFGHEAPQRLALAGFAASLGTRAARSTPGASAVMFRNCARGDGRSARIRVSRSPG